MSVKRLRNRRTSSLTNLPSSSAFIKAASSPISLSYIPYRVISCTPILNSDGFLCPCLREAYCNW